MPLLAHDSYGRKLAPLKGKDDKRPVTEAEIEHTHDRIRSHMRSRASSFRENFKRYDRDRSGKIDMHEATEMLMSLNLHNVREKCLHEIFKLADEDNSGEIDYAEFCVLISAEDALPLAKGRKLASELEGGPWLPQGGRNISSLALTLRSSPSLERFNELHMARHLGQTLSKDSLTAHTTIKKLERGKPFDRAMWLERTNFRRQEEALARHQPLLRTFAPRKIPKMSYEEGLVAVKFYNEGGEAWKDWSRTNWDFPSSRPGTSPMKSSSSSSALLRPPSSSALLR